jgi:MYXO-CTERM domain-containing protein
MVNSARSIAFPTLLLASLWLMSPSAAEADLEACGGIFLAGDANCDYRPREECMTECMTVAVETACVTNVYNECQSSCTTTSTTECETNCSTSCVNQCTTTSTTEQGTSCMDLCLSDCEEDDEDQYCGSAKYRNACGRCKKHTCEKRCEQKCGDASEQVKVTTTTECMPTCTNACNASCTDKVNTQCQVDCQERTYTECEQQMVEQCQTTCKDKGGAIFCDGQFVNAANADSCADELYSKLSIEIDIDGAAEDVGDAVEEAAGTVKAEADSVCSVSHVGRSSGAFAMFAPLAALALARLRRRAQKRSL